MDKKKYYITTAIAYTSGKPHIGNTYEAVLADSIARFKRQQGYDVFFQTGTDEHGQKIELKAEEAGVTCKEFVDKVSGEIKNIWDLMNTSYDKFIRTTDADHEKQVQKIFLQDNGKLYTDSMLKYHVNIMIYENDIRDDKGNYFEFRTHRFRHTFGVKLTEMKLDDDSIARLLGHKDTRTIPHYRRLRNEALAEDTKAVRDEMNELLAQYRREKENAETR